MSPYQHGEVFVTDDGAETDLDLGHYERFTGRSANQTDNITTGRIYKNIIEQRAARRLSRRDRAGHSARHRRDQEFRRSTAMRSIDFVLCEIGGTVGDIEAMPFLEAIRQLGNDLPRNNAVYVHLTLMPYIPTAGELKTKPTQHSVKELRVDRHRARHPAGARRPRHPQGGAPQAVAVLQRARERRHPGARRRAHLRRADGLSQGRARFGSAGRLRHRAGAEAAHGALAGRLAAASTIPKARSRSPSSANIPASRTPTNR